MGSLMSLQVFTARIGCPDPDAFDITRAGADRARNAGVAPLGEPFAPTRSILDPALKVRDISKAKRELALTMKAAGKEELADLLVAMVGEAEAITWSLYAPAYAAEMRLSFREHRQAWDKLLKRPRVVLVCYCPDRERCHRGLLAGILAKCGAVDKGELRKEAAPVVVRDVKPSNIMEGSGTDARLGLEETREAQAELAELVGATRAIVENLAETGQEGALV